MNITVKNNKVNPFPTCSLEEFNLGVEWYLPQHLPLLKELTQNDKLEWDFSSKPPEERLMYKKIYRQTEWQGDLGLLFYRTINGYWSKLLPKRWMEDKLNGLILEEEIQKWDQVIPRLWEIQHKQFLREEEKRKQDKFSPEARRVRKAKRRRARKKMLKERSAANG